MPDICLYFQVHQPNRLRASAAERKGDKVSYENDEMNAEILGRVADRCYLPANRMFKKLIEAHGGRFRMALSISGTVIEQMERHRPDVLESFQELVAAGGVELLAETYHHSLAFLHSNKEFDRQVDLHLEKIEKVFHVRPRVFRNTELIYNDAIAAKAETLGFDGVIAEGVDRNLKGKSPNFLYTAPETARIKTLLRNSWLSDDLGFRFSDKTWVDYPLTAKKFAAWLADSPGDLINLFMGYETIGEHQDIVTGIFDFWEMLPDEVEEAGLQWVTPTEAVELYRASHEYSSRFLTSWTDAERDLSAWTGNEMQIDAMVQVHALEKEVMLVNDPELTHAWASILTSNHFHWMSTKGGADGNVRSPLIPYPSARDAHTRLMNVVTDLRMRLAKAKEKSGLVCAS
ncbi:MAG: polysaccharide deacetylase family protein [Gloeobacteraceae cyanobacterium ES-bin-144]|nr:polysaccharide deacetylase family protein [Verrucomicrobiales bacterium]